MIVLPLQILRVVLDSSYALLALLASDSPIKILPYQ